MAESRWVVGRLRDGVSAEAAALELTGITREVDRRTRGTASGESQVGVKQFTDLFSERGRSSVLAALMLGVCDKIVPGLVIGALSFGHLPTLLVPAGPMTSGLSNALKSKVRQQYATGDIGRDELLAAEAQRLVGARVGSGDEPVQRHRDLEGDVGHGAR